ncbi:MFS general substrate transporter [Leucogyrophana mollusca]|uniref:MFS general substrate transporter n=1 Tax=Leucogyrophana mollusca TaxID=85980 RepID=A0ACB8B5U7_9AGAM|nr:MFS general substrate transporter [Leucogyrophana mollusca]
MHEPTFEAASEYSQVIEHHVTVDSEKHDSLASENLSLGLSHADGVDREYELKCGLINRCLQEEIGFGRYQAQLFVLTGFGWLADDMWFQALAVALPQIQQELNPSRVEYSVLAEYAGLIIGATLWGVLADIIGRKLSFNITLFIAGVFGLSAGASPNFLVFSSMVACMGFGVGGNLPVDGALYLEHIPGSHQWTLTLLSLWWAAGQLVASLVAWIFIANFSCDPSIPDGECTKAQNMGWRYTFYTLGALTLVFFICRFLLFDVQESSKFLVAQGRDEEAIQVLEHIARRNGKSITLRVEDLQAISRNAASGTNPSPKMPLTIVGAFSNLSLDQHCSYYPYLGASLLTLGAVSGSSDLAETYRNYSIISVLGIPGSLMACAVVDWTKKSRHGSVAGGRKLSLAVSTVLTGAFLFLFTTSKTTAAVLGWSCASGLTQNAMYGVLYAYTPEAFPSPHRGTGDALCAALNRIGGLIAPLVKMATTPATGNISGNRATRSVFVSATLLVVAGLMALVLPIETAGQMAL